MVLLLLVGKRSFNYFVRGEVFRCLVVYFRYFIYGRCVVGGIKLLFLGSRGYFLRI